jgi:single-strand DNA-binding protein
MSQITIVGNLGTDPELKFSPSGTPMARFSVGVTKRVYDRAANEWKDGAVSWFDVTAFRHLAEHIAESLLKGSRVVVVGEMEQRSWVDEKSGEKRYAWGITASSVGAELTFATAALTKATTQGRAQVSPDDPWASASKTRPETPATAGWDVSAGGSEVPF